MVATAVVATAVVTGFAEKTINNFRQIYVTRLAKLVVVVVVVPHPATLPETEAALAPETSLSISRLGGMREAKTIFREKIEIAYAVAQKYFEKLNFFAQG